MSFNASVFKDPSGDVRGIFASARDITEQARLQAEVNRLKGVARSRSAGKAGPNHGGLAEGQDTSG